MTQVVITATATLCAVVLGGWLTLRAQERMWRRDTERQWRDLRLQAYTDFLAAFREFAAYAVLPTAVVSAAPRQGGEGDLMPFFNEEGTRHKERLEVTKTSLRLVAGSAEIVHAANAMVHGARRVAVSRADRAAGEIPAELFESLWAAERQFVNAARREIGLGAALELSARGEPGSPAAAAQ